MRKILLYIFFCAIIHAENPANNPTINNNPQFLNPNFTNAPVHNTNISPHFITNTTSTINAVGVQIRDLTLSIIQKAQDTFTKENYDRAQQYMQQVLWHYRYKIAAGTLVSTYAIINTLLITDYYYLKDMQRWSQWKADYTFEHLCSIPQTELAQDLLRAIGKQHYNKKNPSDASHPLIAFIEAIETEIKTCKRYGALAKGIKTLHSMHIFFTNDTKINQINVCLERCLFIKHIFLSWLAERNMITKSLKNRRFDRIKTLIRWPYNHSQ